MRALTIGFSPAAFSYYLAKYSNSTLIMVTMAMRRDPKASEPK